MTEEPYQEEYRIEDHIIAHAYAMLMMLSKNEPEEFRSTKEDLLEARSYLIGEKPFSKARIPPNNV